MATSDHVPIRTCVVCGKKKPKDDLLRLALDPDSEVIVPDVRRRMTGRGAYVCPGCVPRARLTRRIQKAFRNKAKGLSDNLTDYCSWHAS